MFTEVTQRWRGRRASYRPAGEPINTRLYEVAEIPGDTAARTYVEAAHYSGTYPAAKERFGLYRGAQLVGVAVFSVPCNSATLTNVFPKDNLDNLLACVFPKSALDNTLELGRFVLDDDVPSNGESWFYARCRELLKRDGYVGIVSFSDDIARTDSEGRQTFAGHIGTIYQSSGGAFLGRGTARTLRLLPDGRVFSDRAAQKIRAGSKGWRYATGQLEAFGASPAPEGNEERREWLRYWTTRLTRPLAHRGNLKYAWSLDKAVRLPDSLPYPKIKAADLQPSLFGAGATAGGRLDQLNIMGVAA